MKTIVSKNNCIVGVNVYSNNCLQNNSQGLCEIFDVGKGGYSPKWGFQIFSFAYLESEAMNYSFSAKTK